MWHFKTVRTISKRAARLFESPLYNILHLLQHARVSITAYFKSVVVGKAQRTNIWCVRANH